MEGAFFLISSESYNIWDIKLVDLFKLVGTRLSLVCCLVIRSITCGFL